MKNLLLFLGLLTQTGLAEIPRIDSLKRELGRLDGKSNEYARDTLRCQTLKALMKTYSDVNIDSSAYYNNLMIELCRDPKLQKELIYAYQYAGYIYQMRGDYYQCIRFHYKALPLAEQLKQYSRMARSYGALAHAYTSLKNYDKATKLCQQGLAVLSNYPDTTIKLSILNVFGAIYREQGKLTEALKLNQDMYKLAQTAHIQWYEAQGLHTIGWDYMEMGDMSQALAYYEKALILAHKIGSADLEGSVLMHIAHVYMKQKKWLKALAYCNWAKHTAAQVKNSSIVAEAYEKLSEIFSQTGEPVKALKAYKDFVSLRDNSSKEKTQHRIETLQAQYDNVQKTNALQEEKMNRLDEQKTRNGLFLVLVAILLVTSLLFWNNRRLQAKNREINRQRALLETTQKQLAEINKTLEIRVEDRTKELVDANRKLIRTNEKIKEALFKGQTIERKRVALELHDNLSSLLSAVNMSIQSINPQNLPDSEQSIYRNVKQLIQNAYAEVRNISHNILPAELEREGLVTTLTTLVERLNQSLPLHFSLTISGSQKRMPVEIEFNVYSIVLELVNNAVKHAKATAVVISLLRTDAGIDVSVTDDGIGLEQNHSKRGVGLQNIQARLESLGGTFSNTLPTGRGTRIGIKIPIETVRINGNIPIT